MTPSAPSSPAERLRAYRERRGHTLHDVAAITGLHANTLRGWEQGSVPKPGSWARAQARYYYGLADIDFPQSRFICQHRKRNHSRVIAHVHRVVRAAYQRWHPDARPSDCVPVTEVQEFLSRLQSVLKGAALIVLLACVPAHAQLAIVTARQSVAMAWDIPSGCSPTCEVGRAKIGAAVPSSTWRITGTNATLTPPSQSGLYAYAVRSLGPGTNRTPWAWSTNPADTATAPWAISWRKR